MRSAGTLRYTVSLWRIESPNQIELVFILLGFQHVLQLCCLPLYRNWPTCMTHCIVHTAKWRRWCIQARGCWGRTSEWLSLARYVQPLDCSYTVCPLGFKVGCSFPNKHIACVTVNYENVTEEHRLASCWIYFKSTTACSNILWPNFSAFFF